MARRLAGRFGYPDAPDHFDVTLHPDRLDQPLHWRKPRRVFVCSMSDLFHEEVPFEFTMEVFETMEATPEHTYQVLTKRPQRMVSFYHWMCEEEYDSSVGMYGNWPWPRNCWAGVTAENQEAANERIPHLLETPAEVRFVSCEPLLGGVDLRDYMRGFARFLSSSGLDWVIVGGESGPGARPMHPDWVRSLRNQCKGSGVPFFFKQWGAWAHIPSDTRKYPNAEKYWWSSRNLMAHVSKKRAGRLLDGREWNQYPDAS
jgi:protein gp37